MDQYHPNRAKNKMENAGPNRALHRTGEDAASSRQKKYHDSRRILLPNLRLIAPLLRVDKIRAPCSPINPGTRRKPSLFRLGVGDPTKLCKMGCYQIIF
jgi:hypothetical protein